MGKESENSLGKAVIVVFNENKTPTFLPVLIEDSQEEIAKYLAGQARQVETRLIKLDRQRKNLSRFRSQNRIRRVTEIREIKDCLDSELRANLDKKDIFEGKKAIPIRIVTERGRIKGYELSTFKEDEQKVWWKFIVANNMLPEVARIVAKYPEALDLMTEAFQLRTKMRTALYKEEIDQAKEKLNLFLERYTQAVSEKQAEDMTSVMKTISQIGRG